MICSRIEWLSKRLFQRRLCGETSRRFLRLTSIADGGGEPEEFRLVAQIADKAEKPFLRAKALSVPEDLMYGLKPVPFKTRRFLHETRVFISLSVEPEGFRLDAD